MRRQPLLTPPQRELVLDFSAAVFGLAIAVSLYPTFLGPARPGQLPGYMTSQNLDAHGPFRFLATVIFLTLGVAALSRPIARLLVRADTQEWARNGVIGATAIAAWHVSINRNLVWTAVPAAFGIAACVLMRRVPAGFSRRDLILIPSIGATFLGIADLLPPMAVERVMIVSAAAVLAVRLTLGFIRRESGLAAPLCFAAAPLALMLESHLLGRDQRHAGWPALAIVLITPFLLRLTLANTPVVCRRIVFALAFVLYPLAVYGYSSATGIVAAEGKPRVNFFEDSQHLTPANELLRGEKPYRDIIPPHGLIQDGLFDYSILRAGPETIGKVLRTRGTVSLLCSVAIYGLAAATAGSAEIGLLAFFVTALMGYANGSLRFLPWLATIALTAGAARRRSHRLLALAAAACMVAGLTSMELGVYGLIVLAMVVFRFGPSSRERLRAAGWVAAGAAIVVVPTLIGLAIAGVLTDFFTVSFLEVATLGPVYTLPPFTSPESMARPLPEMLPAIFDRVATFYVLWIVVLPLFAVALVRRRTGSWRGKRESMFVLLASTIVCAISYAERHHLYFTFFGPSLMVVGAWMLARSRNTLARATSLALALIIAILCGFTSHIAIAGWLRRSRGPLDPGWVELGLPRAQGAFFTEGDAGLIDSVKRYAEANLREDETFFDFTNRPLFYFLLNRDVPVRQIEPAFYETEERQREVIARLQLNTHVRAAIVPPAGGDPTAIDHVSNRDRAPLVWKFIEENFEPAFEEGTVVIWRRKQ